MSHIFFAGAKPDAPRPPATRSGHRSRGDDGASAETRHFLDWLLRRAGLSAAAYRTASLARRLPACLRAIPAATLAEARRKLTEDPQRLSPALDALLIGVSGFFREPEAFRVLREKVLPQLLRRRGGVRVCSAGCANGQELYSLAAVLAELGGLAQSHLLGVDCRPGAIEQARAGWYAPEELEPVPPVLRQRYFFHEGGRVRVAPALRQRVRWHTGDILTSATGLTWDVIVCRNVSIYLSADTARQMWERFSRDLTGHGVLVTGQAEGPLESPALRRLAPCVYQKRTARIRIKFP